MFGYRLRGLLSLLLNGSRIDHFVIPVSWDVIEVCEEFDDPQTGMQNHKDTTIHTTDTVDWMHIASTMGTGSLGREIELDALVSGVKDVHSSVESNFSSASMVTLYFEEDSPAYTVYRTGALQIRGAKSEEELEEAEKLFRSTLSELGISAPDYKFQHVTSVFVDDLGTKLNLGSLFHVLGFENTEYEPEQFPAVIHKYPEYGVTLLVFSSGKVIIGGTTKRDVARHAIRDLSRSIGVD